MIYKFNATSFKISAGYFPLHPQQNDKQILKFIWKFKRPRIAKTWKRTKVGDILTNFKTYKTVVIKTVWYWHKDRLKDQWNNTENREIS